MVPLAVIAREWGRIGVLGFGGPPAHIAMLRALCVERRRWVDASAFEDAIAAVNLLPGPASTQLAILCAFRLRGWRGGLVGGLCFIVPGLVLVLALAAAVLSSGAPGWLSGAGLGAGAAVPAVAVQTGLGLLRASWARALERRARWLAWVLAGGIAAALTGPFVVLVLLACGAAELARGRPGAVAIAVPLLPAVVRGGTGALAWTAFKVGALSYGGGFVIIPLMQSDAVRGQHWMSASQFLDAVALGQITPGPVVHTVAAVGYAAHGVVGGLLAALVAFTPSFAFVFFGSRRFRELLRNASVRAFVDGAGPAALGAILGSAVPLTRALEHGWQGLVLAGAAIALLVLRRSVVLVLLVAAAAGALAGG